jgi:hypothetical protein
MCDLTYLQVLELTNRREDCISIGKQYEKNNITYDKSQYTDLQINFIEFGMFCIHHNLNSDDLDVYDSYMECDMKDWNIDDVKYDSLEENQLYIFLNRLKTGEYKVIIINEQTLLILENERYLEIWEDELYDFLTDGIVEVGYDTLKIINRNNGESIFLEGLTECSEGEIIARKWLDDNCEYSVLVKDNPYQCKFREDNFKSLEDCYELTKKIIEVHRVRKNPMMNWDCIKIIYKNDNGQMKSEIWQSN